jgi:putative ABC transport system permease protein
MNILKLIRFSFRNVFRNRRRTLLTLCVAASGFASIAIVAGYFDFTFDGLQELTIRNGFTGNGGTGHFQIFNEEALQNEESYPLEFGIEDYETIISDVRVIDKVSFAMPRIELSGLVSNGEKSISFLGMGVEAKKEGDLIQFFVDKSIRLENSAFYELQNVPNGVLLGKKMAESLQAKTGSPLMLISATVDGAINAIDVTVAGIISTGLKAADSYYLLTHLSTVQGLMQTDKVSKIIVVLHDTKETQSVKPLVSVAIKRNSPLRTLSIIEWVDIAEYYHSIRDAYYIIFSFVGIIVIAIVVLSCTNTMLMATMERISEIGTLRAIGISSKWIMFTFLFEGFLIGIGSVIIGIFFKTIASFVINNLGIWMPPPPGMTTTYLLEVYPATHMIPWIALLIIASTTFSSIVMLWKVRRISIVEALIHV